MTDFPNASELSSLPPKLLIALGVRCGRRTENFYFLNPNRKFIEASLQLAEDYASGADVLSKTEFFRSHDGSKYDSILELARDVQGDLYGQADAASYSGNSMGEIAYFTLENISRLISAICSIEAEGDDAVQNAAGNIRQMGSYVLIDDEDRKAARSDLNKLMDLVNDSESETPACLDATTNGPLGELWPDRPKPTEVKQRYDRPPTVDLGPVFLSYAHEDSRRVKSVATTLIDEGFDVWFDRKSLLPGEELDYAIGKAIESARVCVAFISSNSIAKEGYVNKELSQILDKGTTMPEGRVFLIPVNLDNCPIPRRLKKWIVLDAKKRGWKKELISSLRTALSGNRGDADSQTTT